MRRVIGSGSRARSQGDAMEHDFDLQLWLAPVRNTVWVAARFGHR
ncbi:MAG TPA: hypothetical protein VKQ71_05895 [Acidimicrobiales bacterium]|nr:hypothetical protein [Acidimicrobiales bacterium]